MRKRRVEIVMKFSIDLDPVPGTFHDPVDWINLIERDFMLQKHYNAEVKVMSITTVGEKL